jgi:hypothetical protein
MVIEDELFVGVESWELHRMNLLVFTPIEDAKATRRLIRRRGKSGSNAGART